MKARRAVVFDLDETLYPERRFILSGMAAAAAVVERRAGVPRACVFGALVGSIRSGQRATAFQQLCARYNLPDAFVALLVDVVRTHVPRLRLPATSRRVLEAMRPGWRVGVVTNGPPAIQARKVEALGLERLVDAVVYANEHGTGLGKPEAAAFVEALNRLRVPPDRAVFVGDDPACDVMGARGAGLRTIRLVQGVHRHARVSEVAEADVVVTRLAQVPDAALALLEGVYA